ncbi:FIG01201466: hypothetical protein [hydrothermal vent metagenome]|uniref:Alginate export domain-containing protein n=1 Tax=hydrothermal vent metagenome TaxID=652676 RepID=A0A3B0QTC3_9ZZZZ
MVVRLHSIYLLLVKLFGKIQILPYKVAFSCALIFLLIVVFSSTGSAAEGQWSGYVATEARLFANSPRFSSQDNHAVSAVLQPEYYYEWGGKNSFTFTPFFRLDSADSERTHFDLRELFGLWVFDDWELGAGVRKVYWGVTESQHLVDVINQTDLVEALDGEEKLGQPMINISVPRDFGTFDFFILPYFRKRTFPGKGGRLRQDIIVDSDLAEFESSAEQRHVDFAFRYSLTLNAWDVGLSHFTGTGREPLLRKGTDGSGDEVFIPVYKQINQTGLDLQWTGESILLKLEAIYRTGQGGPFGAWTGGFEYTFYAVSGTGVDIGVLAEWSRDTRDDDATTQLEDDLMAGFRLSVNDVQSTEALAGIVQDIDSDARMVFMEMSRRLGTNWKATLDAFFFLNQGSNDRVNGARDDDYVGLELAYYF